LSGNLLSVSTATSSTPIFRINSIWGATLSLDLTLGRYLIDRLGSTGQSGFILSSTANGVQWIPAPSGGGGSQGFQGPTGPAGSGGSGGASSEIFNPALNRILVATNSSTTQSYAQANLTFNGTTLQIIGTPSATSSILFDVLGGTGTSLLQITNNVTGDLLNVFTPTNSVIFNVSSNNTSLFNGTVSFNSDIRVNGYLIDDTGATGPNGFVLTATQNGVIWTQLPGSSEIFNPALNRILVATNSSTTQSFAQANLTFDGTKLQIIGTSSPTSSVLLDVIGGTGLSLLQVTNDNSGNLFTVNTLTGSSIFNVQANNTSSFNGTVSVNSDIRINRYLIDDTGATGPAGYVLTATQNGVIWTAPSGGGGFQGPTGPSVGGSASGVSVISLTQSSNITDQQSHNVYLIYATASPLQFYLPSAVSNTNLYTFKKVDSTGNTVSIFATSSQRIDGGLTASLRVRNVSVSLVSDSVNWFII
jgi:hypothetical protein